MNEIKDLRHDLINEIMRIEDVDTLNSLYSSITMHKKTEEESIPRGVESAMIEVKKGWTLDRIVSEQAINQITYHELTTIAKEIEWEVSLTELLASID